MRLKEIDLGVIMPDFMTDDPVIKAMNEVLEDVAKNLVSGMGRLSIWNNLEELTEGELDELAYEMNIPWYNNTYSKDKKLSIIKNGEKYVHKMGTPEALQFVIDDIFGSCTISESGIDYEGEPHRFTVTVNSGVNLNQTTYGRFVYLLNKIKRASSWIDSVSSNYSAEGTSYQSAYLSHKVNDRAGCNNLGRVTWPAVGITHSVGVSELIIHRIDVE